MVNEKIDKINRTNQMPIPALKDNTEYIPAGPLTVGVEFRFLTGEAVVADYIRQGLDPAKAPDPAKVPQEKGVSLHVYSTEDMVERLRFDCFEEDPHYHYITAEEKRQVVCPFDRVAFGETLDWSLTAIQDRAVPMLLQAGAAEVAEKVKARTAEVAAAIPEVAAAAQRAIAGAPASPATEVTRQATGRA